MSVPSSTSRRFLPYGAALFVGVAALTLSLLNVPPASVTARPGEPSAAPTPSATVPVAVPSLAAGDELVIISGKDPSGVRQELIDEWNRNNGQARARLWEVTGGTDQQRLDIRAALKNGEAAIAVLDSVHLSEFAAPAEDGAEGLLAELKSDGTLANGFLAGPLATCHWKKALYGLPFNTDVGLLFTAEGAQQPKSWAELMASADTSANRKKIALQLGTNEAFVVNVLEQMLAVDDTILNDKGTGNVVQRQKWEAAIKPLRTAYDAGLIVDSPSEDASTNDFTSGKVLHMRNWPSQLKKIDGRPEVRRLFGPGILGGQNLVVSRKTPYYAQSLELLQFLTNSQSQQRLFRVGGFAPTRKTTYALPEVKQDVPYAAELLEAVEEAHPRPITPQYGRVSRLILNHLRPAVLEGRRLDDSFERDMMEALHD